MGVKLRLNRLDRRLQPLGLGVEHRHQHSDLGRFRQRLGPGLHGLLLQIRGAEFGEPSLVIHRKTQRIAEAPQPIQAGAWAFLEGAPNKPRQTQNNPWITAQHLSRSAQAAEQGTDLHRGNQASRPYNPSVRSGPCFLGR